MKKSWIVLLVLIIEFILMFGSVLGVRINEVMADPNQCPDVDCEYIEIYTENPINLTNWNINTTNQDYDFDFYLEDYLIITRDKEVFLSNFSVDEEKVMELSGISLVNDKESVFLFDNNSELIDDFTYEDTTPGISWQYCSGEWIERNPTPSSSNNCSINNENGNNNQNEGDPPIYLEVDWDDEEIVNGDEFKIKVRAFNLKDETYDLKIWIEFKGNDTIISDRYDDEKEEWKSGKYYIYEFFQGPGNETEYAKLRIIDNYETFFGRGKIFFKLKDYEEDNENIDILKIKEEEEEQENIKNNIESKKSESIQSSSITGDVIKLGVSEVVEQTEDIKTQKNIIYESKTEQIRKYAVYGFSVLCVFICVLLIFKKLK